MPMKTRRVDWPNIKAAICTAGALMVGNVFVAILILGNKNYAGMLLLLIAGMTAIIGAAVETKKEPV